MAESFPQTFAMQIIFPLQGKSRASLVVGRCACEMILLKGIANGLKIWLRSCTPRELRGEWPQQVPYYGRSLRLQRLRDHYLLFEVFHHVRIEPYFGGLLGQSHGVDLVLQFQ